MMTSPLPAVVNKSDEKNVITQYDWTMHEPVFVFAVGSLKPLVSHLNVSEFKYFSVWLA